MKTQLLIITLVFTILNGCSNKKEAAQECKQELKEIEKKINKGNVQAINELIEWETRCKKKHTKKEKASLDVNEEDNKPLGRYMK